MTNVPVTCGIYLFSTARKAVLICHATNSRWNQWSIPKGLTSPDEDFLDAATRELREETGIDLDKLTVVDMIPLSPVKYLKQNKILASFLVIVSNDLEGHVYKSNLVENKDFPEVDAWKWVSIEQAGKTIHESQQRNLDAIKAHVSTY